MRSSGTAEDLEGASFAGQYDTYLDIKGGDALLDAVRRCWASMWTARVVAYRQSKGFGHSDIGIAVVVQTMVEADVAGVMFTGNPMNARADEIVINASWGLGEAVVSGSVTPDEYIVDWDSLNVKQRALGSKELRVVRNLATGNGTVEEAVADDLRDQHTLSDKQAAELAVMGRDVTTYYEGLPQDLEWALADGAFFLLQSRPVTGVDFTWEEDLELWPSIPQDEDTIWTRAAADEWWTGAITPLDWSIRGHWIHRTAISSFKPFGIDDLSEMRWMKYHQGTMYHNTRVDLLIAEYCLPPSLRRPMLAQLHPSQLEEAINRPFDLWRTIKMFADVQLNQPDWSGTNWLDTKITGGRRIRKGGDKYDRRSEAIKTMIPSDEALAAQSDDEIRQMLEVMYPGATYREAERPANPDEIIAFGLKAGGGWATYFLYGACIHALFEAVMTHWYTGENPNARTEVVSGFSERTQQFYDDYDFWKLVDTIRQSEKLLALIRQFEGEAFFNELENHEEGREFLAQSEAFMEMNFFRGTADRDIYYARRIEDPNIDYDALRLMATADQLESPDEREARLVKRREAATAEVIDNLSKQPMGDLKLPVFTFLQGYCLKMYVSRDDSRSMGDVVMFRQKLILRELGRRTISRDLLHGEDDYYFLSIHELFDLLEGREPPALARAKVAGRRKGFEDFRIHRVDPPMFLKGDTPLDVDVADDGTGVVRGTGTSPGMTTGRARIIPTQEDIGSLEEGDILVCHGTDPGWTSAFSIVSAVVAQTGGMLGHFSCLSREYGIPAVSLPNAMQLIEEGSTITVNGSTGEIRLMSD